VVARYTRWGFWKCFYRLRRAGHGWNHKRVHRVYCALRLNLPRRTKRRVPARARQPLVAPARLNETWALDFMTDALYDGRGFRGFRTLNVIDEGNREGLAIEIGTSYLFDSLEQVREITDAWLETYNTERPHDSLGRVPPLTFLPRPDTPAEPTFEVST
jgi:transposase InsO family protein